MEYNKILFGFLVLMLVGVGVLGGVGAVGTYPAVDPSMVLYYHFNNQSEFGENDTRVYDFSGNGNNGTVFSAPHNNTGGYLQDGSFNFGANDNYINVTKNLPVINFNNNFTISLWFYPYEIGSTDTLFTQVNSATSMFTMSVQSSRLRISFSDGTNHRGSAYADLSSANVWYNAIYTFNSNNQSSLYLNGINQTGTASNPSTATTKGTTLGIRSDKNAEFNGSIDEVIVYNKTLNSKEILNLYDTYTINQSITNCMNLTILNGIYNLMNNVNSDKDCFLIQNNNITLNGRGYIINYSRVDSDNRHAVSIIGYNNTLIRDLKIEQGQNVSENDRAIWLNNTYNVIIINNSINTISKGSGGIYAYNSVFVNISNNYFNSIGSEYTRGIFLSDSSNCSIYNNNITTFNLNSMGIAITNSNDSIIRNNIVKTYSDDSYGIGTNFDTTLEETSYRNEFTNNSVNTYGATAEAVYLKNAPFTRLYNNSVNAYYSTAYFLRGNNINYFNITLGEDNLANNLPVNYTWNINDLVLDGKDYTNKGQVILAWQSNLSITNSNFSNYGLTIYNVTNINLNNIKINDTQGYGLDIRYINNLSLENSLFVTNSAGDYGIHCFTTCYNVLIDNVNVTTYQEDSSGIYTGADISDFIVQNSVVTTFGDRSIGLRTIQSSINNTIETRGDNADGIQSPSDLVDSNKISIYGINSSGIFTRYGSSLDNVTIKNNIINMFYDGITVDTAGLRLRGTDNSLIQNNTINVTNTDNSLIGIWSYNNAYNMTLIDNRVYNSFGLAYLFNQSFSTIFNNSVGYGAGKKISLINYTNISLDGAYIYQTEDLLYNYYPDRRFEFYPLSNSLIVYDNGTTIPIYGTNQEYNLTLAPSQYIYVYTYDSEDELLNAIYPDRVYTCTQTSRLGNNLVMIFTALACVAFVVFYIYAKGGWRAITMQDLIIIFIGLIVALILWQTMGQNLGVNDCPVGS